MIEPNGEKYGTVMDGHLLSDPEDKQFAQFIVDGVRFTILVNHPLKPETLEDIVKCIRGYAEYNQLKLLQ